MLQFNALFFYFLLDASLCNKIAIRMFTFRSLYPTTKICGLIDIYLYIAFYSFIGLSSESIKIRRFYKNYYYILYGCWARTGSKTSNGSLTPFSFSADTLNLYSWPSSKPMTSYLVPRTNLLTGSHLPVLVSHFSTT